MSKLSFRYPYYTPAHLNLEGFNEKVTEWENITPRTILYVKSISDEHDELVDDDREVEFYVQFKELGNRSIVYNKKYDTQQRDWKNSSGILFLDEYEFYKRPFTNATSGITIRSAAGIRHNKRIRTHKRKTNKRRRTYKRKMSKK